MFPYFPMNIPISMKHMKMKIFPPGTCLGPRDASHVGALAMPTCWVQKGIHRGKRWLMDVNGYEEWLEYGYIIIKSRSAVVNSTVVNSN